MCGLSTMLKWPLLAVAVSQTRPCHAFIGTTSRSEFVFRTNLQNPPTKQPFPAIERGECTDRAVFVAPLLLSAAPSEVVEEAPLTQSVSSVTEDAEARMEKCVLSVKKSLLSIRTGRANPSILDRVQVRYYGVPTPLNQLAGITVSNAQQLTVEPYDPNILRETERAIVDSGLNLNPNNDGTLIRLTIPPLTEESRKVMLKQCKAIGEDGKVAVRNVRRESVDNLRRLEKAGLGVGKDESRTGQDALQKLTDKFVGEILGVITSKEKEVMTV